MFPRLISERLCVSICSIESHVTVMKTLPYKVLKVICQKKHNLHVNDMWLFIPTPGPLFIIPENVKSDQTFLRFLERIEVIDHYYLGVTVTLHWFN